MFTEYFLNKKQNVVHDSMNQCGKSDAVHRAGGDSCSKCDRNVSSRQFVHADRGKMSRRPPRLKRSVPSVSHGP